MQGNDIRAAQQLLEGHVFETQGGGDERLRLQIEGQHFHVEPARDADGVQPDAPGADDADGLALEIEPAQRLVGKMTAGVRLERFPQSARDGQQQGEGMLRDRVLPIARHVAKR